MVKKMGIAVGALLVLLLATIVVLPMIVDVDKYRPQVVEMANQHLNGKLDLGKLSLSLWGQIHVEIAGLTLNDSAGKPVLGVQDAYFHLPLLPLLTGSPSVVLVMKSPTVTAIKNKAGKLNLLTLAKPSAPEGASQTAAPPVSTPASPGGTSVALPGIATRARLGLEMRGANVSYRDETTGLQSDIKDFNVLLENVSLSRAASLHIWADLDTTMAKAFAVKGPFDLTGSANPKLVDGKFDQLSLTAHLDLDKLDISAAEAFHKAPGVAANADLAITVSTKAAQIERADVKFFNVDIKSSGDVSNLGGVGAPSPVVRYKVTSNDIDLKSWVELVPMLKDFQLGGTARFAAEVSGPVDKMAYRADAKVAGLTAKAPKLKAEAKIDLEVAVETDQLKSLLLTIKAPGNDLEVHGSMRSFATPQGLFSVTSSGMDLDQLIDFPPPSSTPTPAAGQGGSPIENSTQKKPPADIDAMLAPLRANKMLAGASIEVPVNIKLLKARDIKITDLSMKLVFRDLTAAIEHFSMKLWDGAITGDMSVALRPAHPTYHLTAKVDKLDLHQAVASQVHAFKDTVVGIASFDMAADGASFNSDLAMKELKATGKFRVDHAVFASIDVGKMVTDALNSGIAKIGDKVPMAKGKTIPGAPPQGSTKYEAISSSFKIADGKFTAPDFVAKAEPNGGIDLKGNTAVGLVDQSLQTNWEVIDTYNVTKARDLSVTQGSITVPHILARGNDPVRFPVSAGCTIAKPCYSYTDVPQALAAVALANVSDALKGQAGSELKKRLLGNAPTQKAPAPVQNAIDSLKKKFF